MSIQDLRLVGITDDGMHLLLSGRDGTRYHLPLGPALRSAIRHERPRPTNKQAEPAVSSPRQVQALIRAGASTDEVAEVTGWSPEKIARYEGPIIAEREHVASLATSVRLRGGFGEASLLSERVAERLAERGVDAATASWDAWRVAGSPWTLALTFAAGGRLREAAWHFDLVTREVTPVDDEARWLTGDVEPQAPEPLVPLTQPRRVYDVETQGGVHSSALEPDDELEPLLSPAPDKAAPARRPHDKDEDGDLVASVREHSKAGRRRTRQPSTRGRRGKAAQDALPGTDGSAGPVSELDAAVEAIAPSSASAEPVVEPAAAPQSLSTPEAVQPPEAAPVTTDAPPLPQGGPVNDTALTPTPAADDQARMPEPTSAAPTSVEHDDAGDDDGPAVEVEPTEAREVPVIPAHPRVSGQVEFPGMEDPTEAPTCAEVLEAEEQETSPTDAAALADRTQGTASRASEPDKPHDSAGDDASKPNPQPRPNRAQRRSAQGRKTGRPSVPSWDDIMFGSKKSD